MPAILSSQSPPAELRQASKLDLAAQPQAAAAAAAVPRELPSAAECAAHLQLLETFVALHGTVRVLAADAGLGPEEAWESYCNRAVARFEAWSAGSQRPAERMPPVDVLMAWHALMLHPKAYARFIELGGRLGLDGLQWSEISNYTIPEIDLASLAAGAHTGVFTHRSPTGTPLFTYPLAAAIRRQLSFSDKMARHAWLRSPALASTLGRSRGRYARFFRLIAAHPGTVMVPTLDVDLVWHTHQLAPARYLAFSKRAAGRLVDHDDEIEDERLGALAGDMQGLWAAAFGGESYHACLCWACEGGRAGVDAGVVGEALRREEAEAGRGVLPVADLAFPRCGECGEHPESCCPAVEGAAGCGSGCGGGCGGEGGCSSCGAMR